MSFGSGQVGLMSGLGFNVWGTPAKKHSRTASASQKMLFWDTHSHVCHICHKVITRITDAELDHVRAYSKGGSTLKLSHRGCNRAKSNKSLEAARKYVGVRVRHTKKRKTGRKRRRSSNPWSIFG